MTSPNHIPTTSSLRELAAVFLRLGATAFGGPAAHIALMERELVVRRQWLTRQQYLDIVGVASIIPGPTSTEVAIHVGLLRAGWRGLLIAGCCFILPAFLLVLAAAWAYRRYDSLPAVDWVMAGLTPVLLIVVVRAIGALAKTACRTPASALLAAASLVGAALGLHELVVLFGAGAVLALGRLRGVPVLFPLAATIALAPPPTLPRVFLVFLKMGSLLFGSGYLLLAFLRAEIVERYRWITEQQLHDAVTVGQVTPGPLFTTATFVGYLVGGPSAAVAATIGIFLPAFLLVAASGSLIPRLRRSPAAAAFLDGVNAAAVALLAVTAWHLSRAALTDWYAAGVAITAAFLLAHTRATTGLVLLLAAAASLLRHYL